MDNETKELTSQALAVYDSFKNYAIDTPGKYELAAVDLKQAKEILKAVDNKEKEITAPINEGLRNARAMFKPAKDRLAEVIAIINTAMFMFRQKQENEAKKQREEMAKEAGSEDVFVPDVKADIPKTAVKTRKIWKFEVIDKDKIDRKFLIPDEKVIGELVRKLETKAEDIVGKGGIKIFYTETSY